jgi:hypothetical protein
MYKKALMNKSIDAVICDIEKKHDLFFLKYRSVENTPRNGSVRFGFCHLGTEPVPVRFFDGSGSVRFDSVRVFTGSEPSKRVRKALDLIFETWSLYIYIYMHVLYAACARDENFFFFAEIIELNRSFSKLFEFCKSDEN